MPEYEFTGPDGRKFNITFDKPPTPDDFQRATSSLTQQYYPKPQPPPKINDSQYQDFASRYFDTGNPNANKPKALAVRLSTIPAEQRASDPELQQYSSPIAKAAVLRHAYELSEQGRAEYNRNLAAGLVPNPGKASAAETLFGKHAAKEIAADTTPLGRLKQAGIAMIDPENVPITAAAGLASPFISTIGRMAGGALAGATGAKFGPAIAHGLVGEAFTAPNTIEDIKAGRLGSAATDIAIGGTASAIPPVKEKVGKFLNPTETIKPTEIGTGRYADVYNVAGKSVGNAVNRAAVAKDIADIATIQAKRNVLDKLTPDQQQDLGKFLVSERLKNVNPNHPQILSDAETQRIASDPAIQAVLPAHQQVMADIAGLRTSAGLDPKVVEAQIAKNPNFVSLVKETPEGPQVSSFGGSAASRMRKKTTGFAQPATGQAEEYSTNLPEMYKAFYNEATPKATLNDVYASLKESDLLSKEPKEGYLPIEIRRSPVKGESGKSIVTTRYVPKEVEAAIRDITQRPQPQSTAQSAMQGIQSFSTGMQLTANPLEIVSHAHRQLSALAAEPAATAKPLARVTEPIGNLFSVGLASKAGAFMRLALDNASSPENQAILRDITEAGGGTSRAFKHYESSIPGVKNLQRFSHDLLFSIPEGRGIKGFDMRIRLQLEKIRRKVEGNTDSQRIRDFANQVGQYTDKPDRLIEWAKTFNPYSATQLPMRRTEIRQIFGGSGLKAKTPVQGTKLRAETALRGAAGTFAGFVIMNRALSGKWPWENEKGHEWDLNTGVRSEGKPVYLKGTFAMPGTTRPLATLGIQPAMSEAKSTTSKKDVAMAAGLGPTNQLLNIALGNPAAQIPQNLTGLGAYLVKDFKTGKPTPIDISSKPPPGRKQSTQNLIDTLRRLNPTIEYATSYLPERIIGKQKERPRILVKGK